MKLQIDPLNEDEESSGSEEVETSKDQETSLDESQASRQPKKKRVTFDDPESPVDELQASQQSDRKGLKCDVKEHEAKFNAMKGERKLKVVTAKEEEEEVREYAMESFKYFDRDGDLEKRTMEIFSSHIVQALQSVIKEYPGVNFQGPHLSVSGFVEMIFHYRNELQAYIAQQEDDVALLHIGLAIRFMERELRGCLKRYRAVVENATTTPTIEYNDIWMVFRPGSLVFTGKKERRRIMKLVSTKQEKLGIFGIGKPRWHIKCKYVTHDGDEFGYREDTIYITPYEGSKEICKLTIYPLDYHESKEELCAELVERGRLFSELSGIHYKSYYGIVSAVAHEKVLDNCSYVHYYPLEAMMVSGRIVLDTKTFGIAKPESRIVLEKTLAQAANTTKPSTDEELLICDFWKPGFSLSDKRWCWFSIQLIKPVQYNDKAFDSLLLPNDHKNLIRALVKSHGTKDDDFDDLIEGKGRGLLFLLHGVPGVGKTFTAESVADHCKRPLYMLSSGDLGVDPKSVEENLNLALRCATAWNAIVLIDEADVFLEQRTQHDLERNCLVTLFLRILEYYRGILFLSTNRISSFDVAFKSRIHLAIKFQELDVASKKELWKLFINRTSGADMAAWSDKVLDDLAASKVNGRQIKNIVRTAYTLARSMEERLNYTHLKIVLRTTEEFEEDFVEEKAIERSMSMSMHSPVLNGKAW